MVSPTERSADARNQHGADDLDGPAGDPMELALIEAHAAPAHGDVPVGAVIVHDGVVVAARHNERELATDPTAHAETLALRDAAQRVGSWRLDECTMFVTLEPCAMCAGAMVLARLGRVVYAAADPKAGAVDSHFHLLRGAPLNHAVVVERASEDQRERAGELLREFFRSRR